MPDLNLPDAERDVLACVHRLGGATASAVRAALHAYRPMSHGAVVTLLKRLEAKRLLTRQKAPTGKAYVYQPTRNHGANFRGLIKEMLQRVFHGDGVALVASLFETKAPSAAEVEKLQEMLNDLRRRRKKGEP